MRTILAKTTGAHPLRGHSLQPMCGCCLPAHVRGDGGPKGIGQAVCACHRHAAPAGGPVPRLERLIGGGKPLLKVYV